MLSGRKAALMSGSPACRCWSGWSPGMAPTTSAPRWSAPAGPRAGGAGAGRLRGDRRRRLVAVVSAGASGRRFRSAWAAVRARGRQRAAAAGADRRRFHRRAVSCAARRRGTLAAASVIVDVLMQAATQLVFAIVGLVLLIAIGGHDLLVWPIAIGLALAIPALGWFFLAQGGRASGWSSGCCRWWPATASGRCLAPSTICSRNSACSIRDRRGLMRSVVWHFGGLVRRRHRSLDRAALHGPSDRLRAGGDHRKPDARGARRGFCRARARSARKRAALIVLCAIFGVPPEAALALSLVKRVPDLVFGVPGLVGLAGHGGLAFSCQAQPRRDQNERA